MTLETIWIHYSRPRPHWYDLPDAERERLSSTWHRLRAEIPDAQPLGHYHVRGLDDFERVEIWKFPSPDAAFAYWRRLAESGYPEWHSFRNSVGLAAETARGWPGEHRATGPQVGVGASSPVGADSAACRRGGCGSAWMLTP